MPSPAVVVGGRKKINDTWLVVEGKKPTTPSVRP